MGSTSQESWTLLKTWPIPSLSDSIVMDCVGDDSMGGQPGFFDVDDRLKRLSDLGDQLDAFRVRIDDLVVSNITAARQSRCMGTQPARNPHQAQSYEPVANFACLTRNGDPIDVGGLASRISTDLFPRSTRRNGIFALAHCG